MCAIETTVVHEARLCQVIDIEKRMVVLSRGIQHSLVHLLTRVTTVTLGGSVLFGYLADVGIVRGHGNQDNALTHFVEKGSHGLEGHVNTLLVVIQNVDTNADKDCSLCCIHIVEFLR